MLPRRWASPRTTLNTRTPDGRRRTLRRPRLYRSAAALVTVVLALAGPFHAPGESSTPELPLPPRPAGALTGSQIADAVTSLPLADREQAIEREILSGNVPRFLRALKPVNLQPTGSSRTLTCFVTPDYLAVGSDMDFLRVPLTPVTAQRIADRLDAMLPTRRIVDAVWHSAVGKLEPAPIPPSPAMSSVPVFHDHQKLVEKQRAQDGIPDGALLAGIKKDIVITPLLALRPPPPRVAIYGWHRLDGSPIQPLSLVHKATYADYSHGVRLVSRTALLDGKSTSVAALLNDPATASLLSDEGILSNPRYPVTPLPSGIPANGVQPPPGRP